MVAVQGGSALGDSVKIQGQEQSESHKDVSTSEYLLRHCHTVTVSTARLPNHELQMSLYAREPFEHRLTNGTTVLLPSV